MATKYLISYQWREKGLALGEGNISYGMTVQDSLISFLRFVKDIHSLRCTILNVSPLTEEEATEISEKGLYL